MPPPEPEKPVVPPPTSFQEAIKRDVDPSSAEDQHPKATPGAHRRRSRHVVYDDDPLLDRYHNAIITMFYEMRDTLTMNGLMANSRPEGLVDVIKRSTVIQRIEDSSISTDASDFDEMEPTLLDGY
jgi:hypothetical protein